MIWNVMNDYAACANYNIAADSYAWQYTAVSAKPYIIADLDGAGVFKHLIAYGWTSFRAGAHQQGSA